MNIPRTIIWQQFGAAIDNFVELLLYIMRHVQEHAAQLNLMLGQKVGSAPDWVTRARSGVERSSHDKS